MTTNHVVVSRYLAVGVAFAFGAAIGYGLAYLSAMRPSLVPLLSTVIGLLVAFSVPIWQALFVNAPRLSVEISSMMLIGLTPNATMDSVARWAGLTSPSL